ncbi:hypothetical protein NDU88_001738 [Pleurodeles waltl]|uniref:Uncharacterized protein n=1 Tax=Pleurodeles waltl TaxID=8319 RepID=A0AAV7M405_PLEWA|nr:hypothetical protein NDU88_001738 [Pleurodeles waltl]
MPANGHSTSGNTSHSSRGTRKMRCVRFASLNGYACNRPFDRWDSISQQPKKPDDVPYFLREPFVAHSLCRNEHLAGPLV